MPWTPSDGPLRHNRKANTPRKQETWSKVANSMLARTGDDASAIKIANSVIAKMPEYRKKK